MLSNPRKKLLALAATTSLAAASLVAMTPAAVAAPAANADGWTALDDVKPQIVGGKTSSTSKYPWQVRLELEVPGGIALCGGAIIHSRIVLTAAHCAEDATAATAYFGKDLAASGGVASSAAYKFVPPSYNPSTFENDYAMLFFDTPIPAAFSPIKVAGPGESALWRAGRTATVAGFGHVAEGGASSPTLQEVSVPIQSDATCGSSSVYGTLFRSSNMLCAGPMEGGYSTCQGDSGGPLVVPGENGVWRIAGLVSWANGCARPGFPTVFTRIADPSMSSRLVAEITEFRNDVPGLFPGLESNIDILGSGALPPGCSAAQGSSTAANGAAAAARTAADAAAGAAVAAQATLQAVSAEASAAAAKVKKLKKKLKKAKKALKKAKRANKPRAVIKKLTKKVKKAKKKLKKAKQASAAASTQLAAANAALSAANAALANAQQAAAAAQNTANQEAAKAAAACN